ncbi:MAG TPA: tetratricopeptide repeat protein, partial [Candidatus Binatia bacterium]|nr:tetratricopeptide repeat protein [Candidatus Binatia bacterium]
APAPEIRPRPWRAVAWAVAIVLALGLATTDVLYRVLVLNAGELARAGKLAEARGLYETVLRFNPASVEAIDGLAYDAMAAGDTRVALERWERSIRLNPTSAYARVGIGQTYLQLGRVDDAIAHLERAIVLAPDQPSGFLLLANAYAKKGDREKAEAMRARASRAGSGGAAPATRIGY